MLLKPNPMQQRFLKLFFLILFIFGETAFYSTPLVYSADQEKKKEISQKDWAKKITKPGLPNFHQVSKDLYRGAQPESKGFKELKKLGIKTVINLRAFHSDEKLIKGLSFNYVPISFKTWHPEEEDLIRFLQIVTDPKKFPVFVHCQHGADRTGLMCALYRVAVQDWTKEEALQEMTQGGFGYHKVWKNLLDFFKDLNIPELKKKAGIK